MDNNTGNSYRGLQEKGKREILWAKENMPIMDNIVKKYYSKIKLKGVKLGVCLQITKETAVLLLGFKKLGADIFLCPANPLSTKKHIQFFLKRNDITIYANQNNSKSNSLMVDEFYENMERLLDNEPDILIDDGGELHRRAINRKKKFLGGTEETTSGVNTIKSFFAKNKLTYPIIAVNETKTKYLFDNRFGTGQSTIDGILRTTGILLAGKNIIVCGYGWVGKGIARYAKGMGAKVTITEINQIKALEAFFEGYEVKPIEDTLSNGDMFITCTGKDSIINQHHILKMRDGVILANAGHSDSEIDVDFIKKSNKSPYNIRKFLDCYNIHNKKVYLLAEGRVINLIGAEGNPPEIMSLSFANQMLATIYIFKNHKNLENKIYNVPKNIEKHVSQLMLKSFNIKIDSNL